MSSRNTITGTLRWKWAVIFAVLLGSTFAIVGFPTSKAELVSNLNRSIRLGLDLKGGTDMTLQIQVQDAFKAEADGAIERLTQALRREAILYESVERSDPNSVEAADTIQIHLRLAGSAGTKDVTRIARDAVGEQWGLATGSENRYSFTMGQEAALMLHQDTMTQSMRAIDRKIDELGIAETTVQHRGGNRGAEIIIQLPGVDDPARVKSIIQTAALLELCPVIEGPLPSKEAALLRQARLLPLNTKIVPARPFEGVENWYVLARSPVITGRDLRDARAQQSDTPGRWDTGFRLTPEASMRFEQFTALNINKYLAIVLDNVIVSAPRIETTIVGGGRIVGSANAQEAADLALNLRAGSIPAGIKVIEGHRVGPSLGADSVRQGMVAGAVGLALVVASMVFYYRGAGLNAVTALLLNTLITVALLGAAGAAWTLPGIAGLVLSIGMAVDSNVLVFERIKEEMRNGKRISSAVSSGFDRAFLTIVDTHVTTVVASACLFFFGTGLVRGFAVTLAIGLAANLFTAVFVSRAIFDVQLRWKRDRNRLSIGSAHPGRTRETTLDFMGRRKWTLGLSVLMVVVSVASIAGYGLKPGLDFRGGTRMDVKFEQSPGIDNLRQSLSSKLPGEFIVQETGNPGEFTIGTELADEESMEQTRESVEQVLREKGSFEVRSSGLVGPRARADMQYRALLAVLGAFGGMLIYIAFRFKWISGVAAVVATVHDVVITLGLFALTNREISLNVIAAVLTLIGYSMNDKIVVFDRVRENQRAGLRASSFLQLVNLSINQTLSRTILTAGPTLLACLSLYYLGGEVLNGIAFALFVGIVVGTYSSIFVASALLVMWQGTVESKGG